MFKKITSLFLAAVLSCTSVAFADYGYTEAEKEVKYEEKNNIITKFDDVTFNYPVLLADEYPMMSISDLATVIGGSVENGKTLVKDNVKITYTENNRLAEYGEGHLMLERTPVNYNGKLYVPVSSLMPTLYYHMEFFRFSEPPVIEITTGTNYPEVEKVIYAKDFGAVGDGVQDDKQAVIDAINAAVMSGVPTRLEFEKGATYRLSDRMDRGSMIDIRNAKNIEIEGNGCTFLIEKPVNMFVYLRACENVKIKNIEAYWEEHTSTQGVITEVDAENLTFTVKLQDGYPDLPDIGWTKATGSDIGFGQLYHKTEDRPKVTKFDTVYINKNYTKTADREYKIMIPTTRKNVIDCYEVGDRLVIPTRGYAYDIGSVHNGIDNASSAITVFQSKDIVFDGVSIYGSCQLGVSVGLCTGRVTFRNYGMKTRDGNLISANSDGIHYWRNRAGLVVEDSVFMANLDDHINTKGEDAKVLKRIDNKTFVVDYNCNYMVGDEIVFYDIEGKKIIGTGFLKSVVNEKNTYVLTLDREIEGVLAAVTDGATVPTRVYTLGATGAGTIIRNNQFLNSRRHAYIGRSKNSIFEGNEVINCCASGVAAMNEVTADACEGFTPSSFTLKNNYIEGMDGNTNGFYPLEVNSFKSDMYSDAIIDGMLIENNTIKTNNEKHAMLIKATKDLYLLDNTIIYGDKLTGKTLPVAIYNSDIECIDGMRIEGDNSVNTFITIEGCKVSESDIKNIEIPSSHWTKYQIN